MYCVRLWRRALKIKASFRILVLWHAGLPHIKVLRRSRIICIRDLMIQVRIHGGSCRVLGGSQVNGLLDCDRGFSNLSRIVRILMSFPRDIPKHHLLLLFQVLKRSYYNSILCLIVASVGIYGIRLAKVDICHGNWVGGCRLHLILFPLLLKGV